MSLNPQQRKEFSEALRLAFKPDDFDMMLLTRLGKRRSDIVEDTGFERTVFEVIQNAEQKGWTQDLIHAALEENSGNERLRNFAEGLKPPELPAPPTYAHILFISTRRDAADATRDASSEPPSQQFDIIKAEAVKQQVGSQALLVSEVKDSGVVITTFGDAAVLLKVAFHIAQTVQSPQGERLRMGIHRAASSIEKTGEQPTEPPPEGIYTASRLVELGSVGHILATYETGEFLKKYIDFESVFNNKFNELFHVARNRELWPSQPVDVYNIYLTTRDGDGHPTTFGNEQPPKTRVPERVIRDIEVPQTLKELREERIKVTFWPDLPYVKVEFQFEDKKESNIKISCDNKAESEECTFEYDFENHNDKREQVFDINLINKAKNRLVVLKLLCFDRYGKEIAQEPGHPIRLRRYFPLYWWDRFWFSRWYLKVALIALACLIGYAGYLGYRRLTRPKPPVVEEGTTPKEPEEVTGNEMPSAVEFDEDEIKLKEQWDFSGQSIKRDLGISGDPNKALVLTGPQTLLVNPAFLKGKVFKDFIVTFAVKLRPGPSQVGWIFRASPDKKSGYIFILERQADGQFILHGTFDEGDDTPLQYDKLGTERKVLIQPCSDDDWIEITARVHGYTFSYSAQTKTEPATVDCTDGEEQPITPDFQDDKQRFKGGNVGIWVLANNEVLIDYCRIDPYAPE